MTRAQANGIDIEYDTFGDPGDPALLLVTGFTAQLTLWDKRFCQMLADAGRFVIRFDNRDCGLSTKLDGVHVDIMNVMASVGTGTLSHEGIPYLLSDMSADAFGLLDHLGIDNAHVVGASMGGMIAQTMAIEQPERVLTLTSIMSTTGEPEFGQPHPDAMQALLAPPPAEREAYVDQSAATSKVFASPRYYDEAKVRERAAAAYDRSFYPEGAARQLAAILGSGSRADGLRTLRVPTLVIHGRADTLITPSGGDRTAELVPAANLLMLNDMGHDLPEPLWPLIVDAIVSHTKYAIA
jgi:pimeloyl-ACP methyl ester carboxylesterase